MKNGIIIFAPHPDDEILGCGGTIAKKLNQGYNITVVFMTDGRNSLKELGILTDPSPLEMRAMRKAEAKKAAEVVGLREEDLVFLDVEDRKLENNQEMVKAMVTAILEKNPPDEIYLPQKKEFHIDHRVTNRLVKKVLSYLNLHPIEYQYAIAWLYPFNLLTRIRPKKARDLTFSKLLNRDMVHSDISDFLYVKKAALAKYQSQVETISCRQKTPALRRAFLQRFLSNEENFFVER